MDIIMISHKSIPELPGSYYLKEAQELKSLQLLQPTFQQSSPGKILLSASKTSLDIKHRAVKPREGCRFPELKIQTKQCLQRDTLPACYTPNVFTPDRTLPGGTAHQSLIV